MTDPQITVVIPTHNRHDKLARTVESLARQSLPAERYEIVVVDDGSTPPVQLAQPTDGPQVSVVRLEGVERSLARNVGAEKARGELLVFVDDDMEVQPDFLRCHQAAHANWSEALVVGKVSLTADAIRQPFGRFRQALERCGTPATRGLINAPNFCTAQNFSVSHARFLRLGGFTPWIVSGEDQDLALRHTATGGRIAFIPGAEAIHHDSARDLRSYCRRTEWGAEQILPFCRRWPEWPENVERQRVNGPTAWGSEPLSQSLRKCLKSLLSAQPATECLFGLTWLLERTWPSTALLDRLYRALLGIHLFRGYRRGLTRLGSETEASGLTTLIPTVSCKS